MSLSPLYRDFTSSDPELAAVDASVRWPVVCALLAAVHWMVTGTVLAVYAASLKHPADQMPILDVFNWLSEHCGVFTFGRVYPAGIDALLYGWIGSASLGLVMWVLARMGRTPVRSPAALMTAVVFWNLGVAVGLTGILLGQSTSVELLEFPGYAAVLLWCSFALFAYWSILNYLQRGSGQDQIGQWWILVGLLSFVWLYGAGAVTLHRPLPGSGVIQGMLDAWYVHGIFTLFLAPIGLGVLYYLIPKCSGLPLRHSAHARLAFWSWILVAPWTAVHDMVGGPFPEATVSVGLILSGVIFLPVALIGLSLVKTVQEGEHKHHESIVLPFLNVAAMFFVAAGICEQMLSVRTLNVVLHFTMFREANLFLWIYGFFSFIIFGAFYYILPRLLNFGWRSTFLVKAHFYASVYGILLVVGMLAFGGIEQGSKLEDLDPQVTIVTANQVVLSFEIGATLCLCVVSIGNAIFAYHLGWMFLEYLRGGARSVDLDDRPAAPTQHEAALDPAGVEEAHA
jgi:cytochrome c oxidase cbb3-type subunit 1